MEQWRQRGERISALGRSIHLFRSEGEEPLLLLLHGFPSSSFDWRALLQRERRRAALAFDFLGFGLSEKPRDHTYSLFEQADLTLELLRRFAGERPVFLVAHDMGTSVATELMARELDGERTGIAGALLFKAASCSSAPSRRSARSCCAARAARWRRGSRASASSAASSPRCSRPRTRSPQRRPPTSGRCSRTTAITASPTA